METTKPGLKPEEKTETLERKIELWARMIGRHIEEVFFYELLENYLKRYCYDVEISIDENPFINTRVVDGISFIWYGSAHYINEIVCDNTVYELDIEYTIYEFENKYTGDVRTVIDRVDSVSVKRIKEKARE